MTKPRGRWRQLRRHGGDRRGVSRMLDVSSGCGRPRPGRMHAHREPHLRDPLDPPARRMAVVVLTLCVLVRRLRGFRRGDWRVASPRTGCSNRFSSSMSEPRGPAGRENASWPHISRSASFLQATSRRLGDFGAAQVALAGLTQQPLAASRVSTRIVVGPREDQTCASPLHVT